MSDLGFAIVKHNLGLGTDGELPEDFSTGAYKGADTFLDEYEDKKGRIHHKEGKCAGAGWGHVCEPGAEAKGPNVGRGIEKTDDGTKKGVAQAEVCSASASHGKWNTKGHALKARAGFEETTTGVKAGAQAEALRSNVSYGPVGVEAGAMKAGAGFKAGEDGVGANIDATLVEVSGSLGPAKGTLGLSADTGFGVGKDGVEAKFLGTGFKIGREIGFSVGGSGISFKLPW